MVTKTRSGRSLVVGDSESGDSDATFDDWSIGILERRGRGGEEEEDKDEEDDDCVAQR